jgi:hypothetical protein
MTEREKQSKFLRMLARLIDFATAQGYDLTGGDLWSQPKYNVHSKNSFHYRRLAIDMNLFIDGKYCTLTEDYAPLGLYWESLGGTWGGRFKNPDGNHFSFGE